MSQRWSKKQATTKNIISIYQLLANLSKPRLCESDYRYNEYLASPSSRLLQASGRPVLSQVEFDRRFLVRALFHWQVFLVDGRFDRMNLTFISNINASIVTPNSLAKP